MNWKFHWKREGCYWFSCILIYIIILICFNQDKCMLLVNKIKINKKWDTIVETGGLLYFSFILFFYILYLLKNSLKSTLSVHVGHRLRSNYIKLWYFCIIIVNIFILTLICFRCSFSISNSSIDQHTTPTKCYKSEEL